MKLASLALLALLVGCGCPDNAPMNMPPKVMTDEQGNRYFVEPRGISCTFTVRKIQ